MREKFHLGHFITEQHVEKALKLLSLQLSNPSPLYNNLDFTLYRLEDISKYNAKEFYDSFVAKDTFYYFEDLFYTKKYYGIQRAYKIREFHYLSLHNLIIY